MIAPEGIPFVLGSAAVTAAIFFLWPKSLPLAVMGLLLTAFMGWFFRDPERVPPDERGAVISPADGRIVYSADSPPGMYSPEPGKRVSVFMSVLDVHVNRAPVSGKVVAVRYNPGKFLVANVDKASLLNEQNGVVLETPEGRRVSYVQIAGLIARRIVCTLSEGDTVQRGQRVGMICFGSRVDVILPASAVLRVRKGDRVRAGESILGVLP
ncbi:MAG TPA: phosphatidylserine decarboxylase family protein [Candidatus Limnocylindrales bacterium]|nr:phosphatidylserine decarboxylase family protein [Candidatus Limnocylindrales bacterium]